jgi:hypothetical protein
VAFQIFLVRFHRILLGAGRIMTTPTSDSGDQKTHVDKHQHGVLEE